MRKNLLSPFSTGYYITNKKIRVVDWSGHYAVVSNDLYEELSPDDTPLVVKTGQQHYRVFSEGAVPSDTLAIPQKDGNNEMRDILIARPGHAERFLQR